MHTKSLSNPSGTWTLGLKEGTLDIRREIKAGDWVVIHWTRNGEKLHGMMGVIETVQRKRGSAGGVTVEDWTLSGRDFARIFQITSIWFDDYTNYQNNSAGQILGARMNFVPGGSPDQVVNRVISAWLGQGDGGDGRGLIGGAWKWPRGLNHLGEFFTQGLRSIVGNSDPLQIGTVAQPPTSTLFSPTGTVHLRGESFDEAALFTPAIGTFLYDLLMEWSNPLLNELYFDSIVDGRADSTPEKPVPAVFHRERPFINVDEGLDSPWFKLPTHHVTFDTPTDFSSTTNDGERLNLFLLYATGAAGTSFDQYIAYPPSYSRDSLANHGLRKWERSTKFSALANGKQNWVEEIAKWHRLVTSWYGPNHEWLSGEFVTPYIAPDIRIGERLVVGEDNEVEREQYYIESATTTWKYPQHGATTLSLTRGFQGFDGEMMDLVRKEAEVFERRAIQGIEGLIGVSTAELYRFVRGAGQPKR
jgi:hypothetical protein